MYEKTTRYRFINKSEQLTCPLCMRDTVLIQQEVKVGLHTFTYSI